jgi:hypothetical protein
MQTEIWQYNMDSWHCSRLLCLDCCDILSASVSPDYSYILFTTLGIRSEKSEKNKQFCMI